MPAPVLVRVRDPESGPAKLPPASPLPIVSVPEAALTGCTEPLPFRPPIVVASNWIRSWPPESTVMLLPVVADSLFLASRIPPL